jgi:glycerol-3-phosphate dehydrogenase
MQPRMIHAAGIDSPGLAGSPAIALEVVRLLQSAGLVLTPNASFDGKRYPLVMPKKRVKGITFGPKGNKLVQDSGMEGKVGSCRSPR